MKKLLIIASALLLSAPIFGQCAGATPISNSSCLTGQSFVSSMGGIVSGCNGGSNPYTTYSFTAPAGCVDFDISNIASSGPDTDWQWVILNSGCAAVMGQCVEQVADGQSFTITADNVSGVYQLTAGSTYYLLLMGDNACTYDICMSNNVEPSNSCAGALGLGTSSTTYYNGSAGCAFTGTQTGGTGDPTAATMCAGSLENTQWINFVPVAGSTSFQVIGTGINCTGGACAYQFGIFSSPTACGTLTPEGCIANGNACGPGPDPNSAVTAPAGGNGVYTMSWTGVSATGFTGTVSIAAGAFTGTEQFYLVMDGNAGSSCTYTLQGVNVQPLPIELVMFYGKALDNANLLKFIVASQTNNDYYTIERTNDGTNWEAIGTIDGEGTTVIQREYAYVDTDYKPGYNYYRIKQTDFDGFSSYSKIIVVNNTPLPKEVEYIVNASGQYTTLNESGLVIIHYTDGTSEKRVNP